METIKEFFFFLIKNKRLWLLPIMIVFLIIGGLIVFTEGTAIAPFIYSLF